MGWKGFVRSMDAANRRVARQADVRRRDLLRQQRASEQYDELQRAAYAADCYANFIDVLTSLHRDCGEAVNWGSVASAPPPPLAIASAEETGAARALLHSYEPSFWQKIFGHPKAIEAAEIIVRDWDAAFAERSTWSEQKSFAEAILRREPPAMIEALTVLGVFRELEELGLTVEVRPSEAERLYAYVHVHGERIVPKQASTLLKSGKASVKDLPIGKFFEIYQDYVCGTVLRIGREAFAALPIDDIVVTAVTELLDTSTGHMLERPILSVWFRRPALLALNFERVDASDSLKNFVHEMEFAKTKGFAMVEVVRPGLAA